MTIYKYILCALLTAGLVMAEGCSKFLDITPSTLSVNPTKISDFQEILNSDSLSTTYYFLPDLMSDDITMNDDHLSRGSYIYSRTYLWNSALWNAGDTDYMYNLSYSRILQMNIILSRIDAAPADSINTIENRSNVLSEALIQRSWYYLQLANIYGPVYNSATAATDLSVPLVLVPDASTLPSRASVKDMYGRIISDLKTAVDNPYLPAKGQDVVHPGKASGFALLARTYLYMSLFDSASAYADSALALTSALENYNKGYVMPTQVTDLKTNPEVLLARISVDAGYYATYNNVFQIADTLQKLLTGSDLRYTKQFYLGLYEISRSGGVTRIVSDNSVSVPEVMLIKAECLARKGNVTGAATLLETLRSNRLVTGTVSNRVYTADNIMQYVLTERRCELFYHGGLRLFDLKRLNQEAAYKQDLVRKSADSTVIATLPAGSGLYLFPFAPVVIANNPYIVQNPR